MARSGSFRNAAAIVGYGVSRCERHADVPIASLAARVSDAAIADAGLTRGDIDGVACGVSLPVHSAAYRQLRPGFDFVDNAFLAEHLELEPSWSIDTDAFPPALAHAVQAVISGAATYVLVNRTLHNPPGRYNSFDGGAAAGDAQWSVPYGLVAPPAMMAMPYMEYLQRFGARREHMATLAVQTRRNVQRIPQAYWYGRELTVDDYMTSRMISEPMCLFDNDIPVDGSGSFVVTTAERARDLPHKPVYITSWAKVRKQGRRIPGTVGLLDDQHDGGVDLANRLWNDSGWSARDVDVVQLYDGFLPLVWFWLEALGFCGRGEAWELVQGGRIDPGGALPLNSGGGNQGWGRLHGVPHVLECYLQLAGRAGERQQARADRALSTYAMPGHSMGEALLYSADACA